MHDTAGRSPVLHNPKKRAQILEAAKSVFFADGFGAATIDRISVDSHVSKATIYKYFESKQAIFAALVRAETAEGTTEDIDPDQAGPAETLTLIGTEFLRRMLDAASLQMFRLMVAESARFPELGETFEAEGPRRGQQLIANYLAALDERGELRVDDTELAAGQFVGLCQAGVFMRAQLTDYEPSDELIERVVQSAVRVFLRGYAP